MTGCLLLLDEVGEQVVGGPLVETRRLDALARTCGPETGEFPGERAERAAQLGRPPRCVAVPERQPPRLSRRRGHQHPIGGDLLDAPTGRAEQDDVTDPRLVDHLLVQLAHPACLLADEEDTEQTPVGDGASAGDRETTGTGPAGERAGGAVPDDPRAQFGEVVGGVSTGEHVQDGIQHRR